MTNNRSESLFKYIKEYLFIFSLSNKPQTFLSALLVTVLAKWNHEEITVPPGRTKEFKGSKFLLYLSIKFSKNSTCNLIILRSLISFSLYHNTNDNYSNYSSKMLGGGALHPLHPPCWPGVGRRRGFGRFAFRSLLNHHWAGELPHPSPCAGLRPAGTHW